MSKYDSDSLDPRLEAERTGEIVLTNTVGSEVKLTLAGANVTEWRHQKNPLILPYGLYSTPKGERPRGAIPILGPWAGPRTGYDQHGFLRDLPWKVKDVNRGQAILSLEEEGREDFPYPFTASYMVNLSSSTPRLGLSLKIDNTGTEPMPFAPGFHPYFYLPVADRDRLKTNIHGFNPDSYDWQTPTRIPATARPQIINLLLPNRGNMVINTSSTLPNLVVWTEPRLDALCVEPWAGPVGAFEDANGRYDINPGESRVYSFGMEFRPAA